MSKNVQIVSFILPIALTGAFGASAIAAPSILVLVGAKFPVTFTGSGETGTTLETVNGKSLTCSKEKESGTWESTTAGTITINFEGCKKEKVVCRSENKTGEKDSVETILVQGGLREIDLETATKEARGGVIISLNGPVLVNCGGVKEEIKGSVAGLISPINKTIEAGGLATVAFAQSKGKQEIGTCVAEKSSCEKLTKEPLEASLGAGFEAAGVSSHQHWSFSIMIEIMF